MQFHFFFSFTQLTWTSSKPKGVNELDSGFHLRLLSKRSSPSCVTHVKRPFKCAWCRLRCRLPALHVKSSAPCIPQIPAALLQPSAALAGAQIQPLFLQGYPSTFFPLLFFADAQSLVGVALCGTVWHRVTVLCLIVLRSITISLCFKASGVLRFLQSFQLSMSPPASNAISTIKCVYYIG